MEKENQETIKCPFCSEKISALAKKCRFCGEWLEKNNDIISATQPTINKEKDSSKKKNKNSGYLIILVIIIIIIIASFGNDSQTTPSNNQLSLCSDIVSLKNQATTVNFKELDKNPDLFKGKIVKFTGQVLQIQEAYNYGIIRLAVTKESYGWSFSDVVYVEYQNYTDAVKDDVVTVYGQMTGSKTYESQANFNITVPSMTACVVEKGMGESVIQNQSAVVKLSSSKTTSASQTQTQTQPIQQPAKPTASIPTKTEINPISTTAQAPTPTPAPQTDRASVLMILKTNASTEWGDNYQMVKYEYDNQVEAYDWVVAQTKYSDIMMGAKQDWGNNYQMVKYEYENQVEAYEWIMVQTTYPEIMSKAKQEWGTNYQMVKYEYDNQVQAYKSL